MGDVMKESTTIAFTFARALVAQKYPNNDFFEKKVFKNKKKNNTKNLIKTKTI